MSSEDDSRGPMHGPFMEEASIEGNNHTKNDASLSGEGTGISDGDRDLSDDDINLTDEDMDLTEEVSSHPAAPIKTGLPDHYQQTETERIILKDVFEALDLEIEDDAVDLMHLNVEDFIVRYLKSAQLVTVHRGATAIAYEDMQFMRRFMGMIYNDIFPEEGTGR
ncbi:hypothetical protein DL766_005750 [Monosporascus sp. MC13-8B]|uniref:CENP-T/Histone H4 histone fold domain-containing protein n=1 Tax=Monosporascus cannonballus TaxID=155416 RepID=A0ABY0GU57_9PEZI|nr:hypothetical protein DL762_009161 [Monosporascus cannonballus]RYO96549.1 hypothetical protein DL763_003168 [Monosporascus cannonballus]RYP28650.1 hypothetical protein DL766_005750 [Monosporascus sp. MC13-8B]